MKNQPVVIPEEREPSYLNRHLLTGAKFGLIAALGGLAAIATAGIGAAGGAGLATLGVLASNPILSVAAGLGVGVLIGAGSGVGCIKGKEAVARNKVEGRTVNPPSLFNEGMGQGILNGAILGLGAVILAATLAPVASAGIITAAVAGAAAAGTGFLGYYQGKAHQETMQVEYESAKKKAAEYQKGMFDKLIETVKGKDKAPEVTPKITPEESVALHSRLKEGDTRRTDWQETTKNKAVEELSL